MKGRRRAPRAVVAVGLTLGGLGASEAAGQLASRVPFAEIRPVAVLAANESADVAELLYRPGDAVVAADGTVYVLDAGNSRLVRFDATGAFASAYGRRGHGPGEFGVMTSSDTLATDGVHLYTLSATTGEVQVWTTDGAYLDRFRLPAPAADMAATNGHLYFSTLSSGIVPGLTRTTRTGDAARTWAESLYSGNKHWAQQLNVAEIAVASDGEVLLAFRAWPLLWAVQDLESPGHERRWLDFSWVPKPALREKLARPESLLSDPNLVPPGHPEMSWVASWDVDYAAEVDRWYLLTGLNLVHVVGRDLEPLAAFELLGHDASPAEMIRFGVSPDGKKLCAIDPLVSIVRCYATTW